MLLFGISFGFAQDTLLVPIDSVEVDVPVIDSLKLLFTEMIFIILNALFGFLKKMYQLEQRNRVRLTLFILAIRTFKPICSTAKIRTQFQKCMEWRFWIHCFHIA